jgi:hypothetical protein
MDSSVAQVLNAVPDTSIRKALKTVMDCLADRVSTRMLNTPGLVIKAGASALVKSGAADAYGVVDGKLFKITAATDMPALVGTVTNAKFNVYVYFQDSAGTRTTVMGTEGATLAAIVWPTFPRQKAVIGYTIINPTGTGNFVGGTTAIDDGTVVPNAVHVSIVSGFDPSAVLG